MQEPLSGEWNGGLKKAETLIADASNCLQANLQQ
jgi:hypothetical protein